MTPDIFIALLIFIPACLLVAARSNWCVDYTIAVYAFNRGLRRVVDWEAGAFNLFSAISLTPLLVSGLFLIPFLSRWDTLSRRVQAIFCALFAAVAYGFVVGLLRGGFTAVYGLGEYTAPLALMGYCATCDASSAEADRWLRTSGWIAVLVSLYGWFQYLTIPAWDAFWVRAVNFEGYLGELEPAKMTVFSTLNERGPCSTFLALAAIPVAVSSRWRVLFGWPAFLLVMSVVLLTGVRTGVIIAAAGLLLYPLVNGGRGSLRIIILLLLFAGFAASYGLGGLPGAGPIMERFETLKTISQDGSYQGRLAIAGYGFRRFLENPAGFGLGSSGLAGRIHTGAAENDAIISDSGYYEILLSLGWLGAALFVAGFWGIWRHISKLFSLGIPDDFLILARTLFIVFLIALAASNLFVGVSIIWIVIGRALSPAVERAFAAREPATGYECFQDVIHGRSAARGAFGTARGL